MGNLFEPEQEEERVCMCGHHINMHHPSGEFSYPDGSIDFLWLKCGACNECENYGEGL